MLSIQAEILRSKSTVAVLRDGQLALHADASRFVHEGVTALYVRSVVVCLDAVALRKKVSVWSRALPEPLCLLLGNAAIAHT